MQLRINSERVKLDGSLSTLKFVQSRNDEKVEKKRHATESGKLKSITNSPIKDWENFGTTDNGSSVDI